MSKADLSLSKVNLRRVFFAPGKPAFTGNKPIHGWDTETSKGRVFLLTVAWAHEPEGRAYHNDGKPLDPETLFQLLTNRNARASVNVWYNLDFDANVILASLPKEKLIRLTVTGQIEWNGYEISYIPKKLLSIRDSHGHKYQHFDVSQFFFGSLDTALQEWCGRPKDMDGLDRSKFDDPSYLKANWDRIVSYGARDSRDVRDLWNVFVDVSESLSIPCGRPYSTGYLAEQTYNVKFRESGKKPGFVSQSLQEMAWQSYRGGRFEIIERGMVGDVVTVDINSAYPFNLKHLPDPDTLRWRGVNNPTLEMLEAADYGFVRAFVTTDPERPLQPFAVKERGKLIFPVLEDYEVTVTLPEFLFAVRSGLVTEYKVTRAWLGRATPGTDYPFGWIQDLYDERQRLKVQGDTKKQTVLKIIINSLYGKLAQLTEQTEILEDGEKLGRDCLYYPVELLPELFRDHFLDSMDVLYKRVKAGSYFNPFLASYVTGLTRLAILETAITTGLENNVVILATDSLTIRAAPFDSSDFLHLHGGPGLGQWETESRGILFVAGTGVYELEDPETGEIKSRTRGFEPGFGVFGVDLGDTSLQDAARMADGGVIEISNRRPLKIAQALWQNFDVAEIGVFRDFPRGLRAGMDSKRRWDRGDSVTWGELLSGAEKSLPLRVGN